MNVVVDNERISFSLSDGRTISIPLVWSARLMAATSEQRQVFIITPWNIFWDEADEIIGVENVLYGHKLYL
jgi:hypothetical protein